MRLVVANEPAIYRMVISATLNELRPHAQVFAVEPEDLDRECSRLAPCLVLCSQLTEVVEREVPVWIELYPDHGARALVNLDGKTTEFAGMDFEALLSILDEAERLHGPCYLPSRH